MRLVIGVCLSVIVGCAAAPPPKPALGSKPAILAAPSRGATPESDPEAEDVPPERAVAEADGIYRDQLAVPGRDPRFSTDRQVAALKRAIALYEMFLARAGDDPRYEDAAKRSRDRIVDARETIDFLLSQADTRDR